MLGAWCLFLRSCVRPRPRSALRPAVMIFVFFLVIAAASASSTSNSSWTRLLGTNGTDQAGARGVATDSLSRVYMAGYTYGSLDGQTHAGHDDAVVSQFDSSGNKQWTRLLGTSYDDVALGVATDSLNYVYVAGYTDGSLDGHTNAGRSDAFVSQIDSSGNKQWTRLLGTRSDDEAYGVATDSLNRVYVAGSTRGSLDGQTNAGDYDAFVSQFDSSGNKQWTRLLGTSSGDGAGGVATDSLNHVYVAGYTSGSLDGQTYAGGFDAFVSQFDSSGNKQWTRLLGTSSIDEAHGVATDSLHHVYMAGYTYGSLDGQTNAGHYDAFVSQFDSSGNKQWTRLLGTSSTDEAFGVATDSLNRVYVAGYVGETNAGGGQDAFVSLVASPAPTPAVTTPVPTPSPTAAPIPSPTPQPCATEENTDYLGGDMAWHDNVTSAGACCALCAATNGCYSFTWARPGTTFEYPRRCYLKRSWSSTGPPQRRTPQVGHLVTSGNITGTPSPVPEPTPAPTPLVTSEWTRLLGTSSDDVARGVATDSLNHVYVAGWTAGSLDDQTNAGSYDSFVSQFDSSGNKQWTRLLGTSSQDGAYGVATDSLNRVYIAGYTGGSLDGQTNAGGGEDAFVSQFDSSGNKQWTRLLGTSSDDRAFGVTTDSLNHVYVAGYTYGSLDGQTNAGGSDAFVSQFDSSGNKQWTRLLGTSSGDEAYGVATDSLNHVYVAGYTAGSLGDQTNAGSYDSFVSQFDSSGNKQWTRLLGTSSPDFANSVATDSFNHVYVFGYTRGSLEGQTNAGSWDAFVSHLDSSGNKQWTRLLGTSSDDGAYGVATDSLNHVYVAGYTYGSLDGQTNAGGGEDAFVSQFDSSGNKQWTRLLGSRSYDGAYGVVTDSLNRVYVAGYTGGSLDGQTNAGGQDAFVSLVASPAPTPAVTTPVPTPSPTAAPIPSPTPQPCATEENTDYLGGDMAWHDNVTSAGACCALCAATNGCYSFTWARPGTTFEYPRRCYLKRSWSSTGPPRRQAPQVGHLVTSGNITSTPTPVPEPTPAPTPLVTSEWTRFLCRSGFCQALGVATDSLNHVYVDGQTNAGGGPDAFVSQFDSSGNKQWTRLLGSSSLDRASGVATDSLNNVYVTGYTGGSLEGQTNAGSWDAFVSQFDSSGNKQWTRLLGTSSDDRAYGVATDSLNHVYVAGYTYGLLDGQTNAGGYDAFVSQFDSSGNKQWTRLLGTSFLDQAYGVATDSFNHVYVAGYTYGSLDGQTNAGRYDAFVSQFDSSGNKQWTRLLGTSSDDQAYGVATDSLNHVYVAGYTYGSLDGQTNAGGDDAFVSQFDSSGNKQWTRLLGTSGTDDGAYGVATDSLNHVYVAGYIYGSLDGQTYAGGLDAFVSQFDSSGNKQWTRRLGTNSTEAAYGVATDALNRVYIAGAGLAGSGAYLHHFVYRDPPTPEPTPSEREHHLSAGAIGGVVVVVIAVTITAALAALLFVRRKRRLQLRQQDNEPVEEEEEKEAEEAPEEGPPGGLALQHAVAAAEPEPEEADEKDDVQLLSPQGESSGETAHLRMDEVELAEYEPGYYDDHSLVVGSQADGVALVRL